MLAGLTFAAHSTFPWVCTTALGLDVVPEVNMIPTGRRGSGLRAGTAAASPKSDSKSSKPWSSCSGVAGSPELSSVTTTQDSSGPASATTAANWGWVMAATAPECWMKYSISAATLRMLVVTVIPPRRATAYQAMTASGQLSEWIRTVSPSPIPRAARPPASSPGGLGELGVGPGAAGCRPWAPTPGRCGRRGARPAGRAASGTSWPRNWYRAIVWGSSVSSVPVVSSCAMVVGPSGWMDP